MKDAICIVDLGSQYTQLIARRIRELGVYSEVVDASTPAHSLLQARGIIFSGSPDSIDAQWSLDPALLGGTVPVLGICFGFHMLCEQFGGRIAKQSSQGGEFGSAEVRHSDTSDLFRGVPTVFTAWMSHNDSIADIGNQLQQIASSANGTVAALEFPGKHLYAVQFHPEVSHTQYGDHILKNFVLDICRCIPNWRIDDIIKSKQQQIAAQIGTDTVLLGLSGGVDSSVVAALLDSVIGKRLQAVFIDTGLLRAGEAEQVQQTFGKQFTIDLHVIDASERFFDALKGVVDPEEKRKIIGRLFIQEFEQAALQHADCTWLAQGTIYPDVIESSDPKLSQKSKVIKSHHNVGGLPENMTLKLIEPLRDLFKDEVRRVGEALGLPHEMVWRHPFPGPGLAVRVMGEVKPEFIHILRQADAIYLQMLQEANLMHSISQAFAVFLPVKTVGVKGDDRAYEYAIALRAVQTDDFMTATAAPIDHSLLGAIATRIVNRVAGVTRVCYDITSKPPATVEWE